MFSSLRARLTLWYVGAFSVILILFSGGVFFFAGRTLRERQDTNLRSTLQSASSGLTRYAAHAGGSLPADALENPRFSGQVVTLLDLEGRVLAKRPTDSVLPLRLPSFSERPSESPRFYELEESNSESDDGCRGVYQRVADASQNAYVLIVAESSEPLNDQLDAIQNSLMIAIVLALLLVGSGGWLLARASLAPVTAMATATERITAKNLDERLPVKNSRDELGRLASTFNNLLSRLSVAFSQQRQFMAEASHELRTPLSVIQTTSQVTLQTPGRSEDEYREAMAMIEQQARRLTGIVKDMFVLARADAGDRALQCGDVYLDELLAEIARAAAMLASQKNLQIEVQPLQEAPFRGDEGLLRQMIWNLVDNAIKHTPESGKVWIALESRETEYVITVRDTGNGISPEDQGHIFERFYRGDQARSRTETVTGGGAGLGLPIARWVAEAHHGRLELQRSDASGSTFAAFLPRS